MEWPDVKKKVARAFFVRGFDSIPTGFLILQCQLGGSRYFTLVLKVGRFPLRKRRIAATPEETRFSP